MKLSSNKRADRLTPGLIEKWLDGIKDSGKQNTALQVHTRLVGIIKKGDAAWIGRGEYSHKSRA